MKGMDWCEGKRLTARNRNWGNGPAVLDRGHRTTPGGYGTTQGSRLGFVVEGHGRQKAGRRATASLRDGVAGSISRQVLVGRYWPADPAVGDGRLRIDAGGL